MVSHPFSGIFFYSSRGVRTYGMFFGGGNGAGYCVLCFTWLPGYLPEERYLGVVCMLLGLWMDGWVGGWMYTLLVKGEGHSLVGVGVGVGGCELGREDKGVNKSVMFSPQSLSSVVVDVDVVAVVIFDYGAAR